MPSEFIEGRNRITAEIIDLGESRVGPGDLMTCLDLSYDALLNQAGSYTARFPANDPRLAYLQLKKTHLAFRYDGEEDPLFYGMADSWRYELSNDGQQVLVVTGRDMLGELAEIPVRNFTLEDGAGPIFNAIDQIFLIGTIPPGWGVGGAASTETGVYASLAGEPVLSALTRIAEHIGESFRVDFHRVLHWIGPGVELSGVRAIQGAGDPIAAENNQSICFIQRLTERRDATRMITTIHPQGSGLGETQLDLEGTSRVAPAGFTLDEVNNSITSDAALAYMEGQTRGRRVDFKDIRPLFNTDADVQSAKDYLFDTALEYLKRNDSIDDVVEYDLDVLQLPRSVRVGMSIRVIYQDDRRDIDLDLFILGIRTTIGSDGAISYSLTVAPINQWRLKETSQLTAQVEEGEIFAAHPQIDASVYWMTFREEVGDDQTEHIAEFHFRLSEEVLTIRQGLFVYKVEPLLSAVGVVTYASPDTALNVASVTGPTNTEATVGPSTPNTGIESTPNTGTSNANTSEESATNSGPSNIASGSSSANDTGNKAIALNYATGLSTNADPNPTATENNATGTPITINVNTQIDTTNLVLSGPDHIHALTHGHAADLPQHWHGQNSHIHSIPDHLHTTTTADHNHTITHTHTLNNHTHTIGHIHTLNNHMHTLNNHTHPMQAHTHDMPHNHDSPQHVHAAPTLVTTYTLRRTPALNSYVMADLEYSVNGGDWESLDTGVPVAGGYYQLDVTSSIQNPAGLKRPWQPDNLVQVRRKTAAGTGKTAMVRAQIGIRSTIQSVVVYS